MATTEPVGDYLLQAAGTRNLTPFAFQADVMNGVDPAPQYVSLEDGLFSGHKVKVFLYNQQVTDSLTASFLAAAHRDGIPVVGVYETMPEPGYDYQSWMLAETNALERAVAHKISTERLQVMARPVGERPAAGRPAENGPQENGATARRTPGNSSMCEGVSLWLSGRKILDDVSFALRPGEFTGLIGSNGAGKTTLLRVILGLQAPSAGTVRVAGQPRTRRGSLIGYVPQKILLDPDMPLRARDLVGLGLDGQRLGLPLPSARRRQQVDEMLRAVGADRFGDTRVGLLSGGEQQRVLIAHALISRPRLLLLDEPLANLDIASEQDVVELLGQVAREQQIAVLISAHDMNPLLPVMDRLVYMAAGRAASGTTAEVVRPEVLSELYGQHVDVIRVHGRILVVAAAHGVGLDVPQPGTGTGHSRGRVIRPCPPCCT